MDIYQKFLLLSWDDNSWVVRYPTDLNSAEVRFQLEAFCVSNHAEKLYYNETVCQGFWVFSLLYISFPVLFNAKAIFQEE